MDRFAREIKHNAMTEKEQKGEDFAFYYIEKNVEEITFLIVLWLVY